MGKTDGLIKPLRAPTGLEPGFSALMVSHPSDLAALRKNLKFKEDAGHGVLMSRLYATDGLVLLGPFMGAPYAAALLEHLIAWGAGSIVYYGWAGALTAGLTIGDMLIPTRALVDEGTTRSYFYHNIKETFPDSGLQAHLAASMDVSPAKSHTGAIWTTDGLFNETPEKIAHYQAREALAVEMEASALFSVASIRSVRIGCLLAISDDLSRGVWQPGFKDRRFKDTRHRLSSLLPEMLMTKGDL
jgi:uridine phosphorylase